MQEEDVTVEEEMRGNMRDLIEEENSRWVLQNFKRISSILGGHFLKVKRNML